MASELGRGAQVRLDGDGRQLARGGTGLRLIDNIREKLEEEAAGAIADGSAPDGSTRNGAAARDEALITGGAALPDALDTANAAAVTATAAASAAAGSAAAAAQAGATAGATAGTTAGAAAGAAAGVAAVQPLADGAALARDQAQAANANARLRYATLALLNTNLAPAANAVAEVDSDGANNGTYLKAGGTGTGSWSRINTATITALDARAATLETSISQPATAPGAFSVVDPSGFVALQVSADVQTLQVSAASMTTTVAGDARFQRADGTSYIDMTAAGPAIAGSTYAPSNDVDWAFADASGFIGAGSRAGVPLAGAPVAAPVAATTLTATTLTADTATIAGVTWTSVASLDYGIADASGFLAFAISGGVAVGLATTSSTTTDPQAAFTAAEVAAASNRGAALSFQVSRQINTEAAYPVYGINHVITYGQSLSNGTEGWPAKSRTAKPYGAKMIGASVRPASQAGTSTAWAPMGGSAVLNDLVAVNSDTNGTILSDAAVAALTPGDQTFGETITEGAVNFLAKLTLQHRGLASDTTRQLVASSCGISGQTIEALSKSASPELFNRLRDCATAGKARATALSTTYGTPALIYCQGESNYPTSTKADYKAKLAQLFADFDADVVGTIAAQTAPAAKFMLQSGAGWTNDTNALGVGQAQLEMASDWLLTPNTTAPRNIYMVGGYYNATDKTNGHQDPNGYRWDAYQIGKVMHRVLNLRQHWLPLMPISIVARQMTLLVTFHVPEPPLVFDLPYVASVATDYTGKGFFVYDDAGTVGIGNPSIVGDCTVQIPLARALSTNPMLRYAGAATYSGNGCLRDSDPTRADDVYEYTSGSGDYAAANIAALVGKPYPLFNWCVAFNQSIAAG